MKKRIASFLLCMALLISIMPYGGVVLSATAEAAATDLVAYVSTAATGSGTIGDANDPFPSLTAAIAALDAAETDGERVAKIMDATYSIKTTDGAELPAHDNPVSVEGYTDSVCVDIIGVVGPNGPTAFDNIKYTFSGGNSSSFSTGGYAVEFGENAVYTASGSYSASGRIYAAYGSNTTMNDSGEPYKLTINDKFFGIYLCAYNRNLTIPGVDFVMNDGDISSSGGIYVGALSGYSTTYTDNVNLEINGGTLGGIKSANYVARSTFTNGAALQIIFNNGTSCSNITVTEESVTAVGGKLYILHSAAGGSTLHATETAGTYAIADPAWQATATDGTNTYTSQDGVLTVGAAGEYTVTWSEAPVEEEPAVIGSTVYVDYTNGDDATTSGTKDAPFKTLTAAIVALDALETSDERTVVLLSDYAIATSDNASSDGGKLPDHDALITITGQTGDEILDLSKAISLGGPLTIDNLQYTFASASSGLYTGGFSLTFGNNAKYTKGSSTNSDSGRIYMCYGATNTTMVSGQPYALTINGANNKLNRVYLHGYNKSLSIPGINFVMNGGTLVFSNGIYIGAVKNYTTTYTDNVNLEINGGTLTGQILIQNDGRALFSNGAALQIIFNNGTYTAEKVSFSDTETAMDNLYILESAAGGSALHATETAGVYAIAEPNAWKAIATDENGNEYTSKYGVLTVPAAGVYTVEWTEAAEGEVPVVVAPTVYVDYTNGDDATESGTEDAPFKTLTAAMRALDALETTDARTVVLLSDYAIAANDSNKLPDHDPLITIKGKTGSEILDLTSTYSIGGPLTIDDVNYTITSATAHLSTGGFALTFGKTAQYTKASSSNSNSGRVYMEYGSSGATTMASGKPYAVTIDGDGNKLSRVYFYNYSQSMTVPGVNFVMNGGTLTAGGGNSSVYVGAPSGKTTTYTGDVNIEINGGTLTGAVIINNDGRALFANGAAVQVIFNNGTYTAEKVNFSDSSATVDNLYILECAYGGSALHATDTAGVYTVADDGYEAVATDGINTYRSNGGVLTVKAAGTYTVTWKKIGRTLTRGVQIREDGALRFVSTIEGLDATRTADGTADYTNAFIEINGVRCSVVMAGTLFARVAQLGDAELLYGAENVYDIPARKLQKAEVAPAAYAVDVEFGDVFFTGVITNIPEFARDQVLVARAYVAYKVGDEIMYAYGNTIRRSYNRILGEEDTPAADGTLKVLALGNSFSMDSMEYLWDMCRDGNIETVVLGNMVISDCTLDMHYENIVNDAATYSYCKNTDGEWGSTNDTAISTALQDEEWDIIVIQQGSAYSGKPDSFTHLDDILAYLEENKPSEDTKIWWNITWAYQADSDHWSFESHYGSDQMTMYNGIIDAVEQKVLTDDRIDAVIPTGSAIQNLRTSHIGDTITRDGFHLSYDYGRYTAALTWYCMLTGRYAATVSAIPSDYPNVENELAVIRESVDNAIAVPFAVTPSTYGKLQTTHKVALTAPANDDEIVLANELVYTWWENYDWQTSTNLSQQYVQDADTYYPIPVTLTWEATEAADSYTVSLSVNADMSDAKQYTVTDSAFSADSLFVATDYYWQVTANFADGTTSDSVIRHFTTAQSPRAIKLDGVSNTRDIGGMMAELDGKQYRIKQGLIYRGAQLASGKFSEKMSEEGAVYYLTELGIKTDLDLRNPNGEARNDLKRLVEELGYDLDLSGYQYINCDGQYYLDDNFGIHLDTGAEGCGNQIIAQEIKVFADSNNYPIFFHCAQGRDRTGTLAMLLEGLLGASKQDIMMDYEMYIFSHRGYSEAPVSHFKGVIEDTYNWIDSNFVGDSFADKVENYLLSITDDEGNAILTAEDITTIREMMLEEV